MEHVIIEKPDVDIWEGADLNQLYQDMIVHYRDFWCHENGECVMRYYADKVKPSRWGNASVIAKADCTDDEMMFLEYYSEGKTLYSLHDDTKLSVSKMILNGDDYSAGFFLPKELAWLAIKDFLETGKPSGQIRWIPLEEVEKIEGANY